MLDGQIALKSMSYTINKWNSALTRSFYLIQEALYKGQMVLRLSIHSII